MKTVMIDGKQVLQWLDRRIATQQNNDALTRGYRLALQHVMEKVQREANEVLKANQEPEESNWVYSHCPHCRSWK
jgi:hypothetical protein